MSKECVNRYKTSRDIAGFTQEHAAAKLNISVRRLSQFENGKTPPDDIAAKMAEIYNDGKLISYHMRIAHPELAKYLPEPFEIKSIYQAIFELRKLGKAAQRAESQLEKLASATISDEEREKRFRIYKKKSSG